MKQTKVLRTALIAVLALVLLCSLVACNKDKTDPDGSTPELSAEMKQLIEDSRADIDAMFNYYLFYAENNGFAEMNIYYYNESDTLIDSSDNYPHASIHFYAGSQSYGVYFFANENDAQREYELNLQENPNSNAHKEGRKIIYDQDVYNAALSCQRPDEITVFGEEIMEFMQSQLHRGAYNNLFCNDSYFDYRESDKQARAKTDSYPAKGRRVTYEGVENNYNDDFVSDFEKFKNINYTADSYIRVNKDTGYCSYKLTYKTGWSVEGDSDVGYAGYYYCDVAPSTLTLPANIGGYDITEAEIIFHDETGYVAGIINHFIIEKAIDYVLLDCQVKEIDIPLSDEAFVEIEENFALQKINFAGTMQQWRDIYGESVKEWMLVYDHWDEETDESVYVDIDISFKVVCKDGTINYPEA